MSQGKQFETKIKSGKTTESLLLKLLQNNLRPRLAETIEKLNKKDYSSFPIATLVDLTSSCNLNCPYCIDRYARIGSKIPTKRMLELLDELKVLGVKSIVYFGGGEPLMHPGIERILERTRELGIDCAINTNGILLGQLSKVIGEACSWTRVSWDAGDPETYKKIHAGKDYFNIVQKNTEELVNKAKGTVGVSFVVMKGNMSNICKATLAAKRIGCDFIQFKPEYVPLKSNRRTTPYYNVKLVPIIKQELNKAKKEENNKFAVLSTGSLEVVLNEQPTSQNKKYCFCSAQQLIPLITPHGVYVCPNWRGAKEMRIGNILNDSLANIWTSEKRKNVITRLNPSKDCNLHCLRHNINVLVNGLLEAKSMNLDLLSCLKEFSGKKLSDRYFI